MRPSLLRRASATAIVAVAFALGASSAIADDVFNNHDASIDSTVEVMPLTIGGADGDTTLEVRPTIGDGKNGCNLTARSLLVVELLSSDVAVATPSPSLLTFDSCGATRRVTVTAWSAGSTTITLREYFNDSGGSFDLAPAAFRVDVSAKQTNTAPTVSVTGVTGGATYEYGSVPAAACSAVDAEDGNSTFAAQLGPITGPLATYGLGAQKATCGYTDAGGLTATSAVTYTIVDTQAPTIAPQGRTPANAAGWNNTDVNLSWMCSDNVAIDVSASVLSGTVSTEGAGQSAQGVCTDVSGNSAKDLQADINIDKTAPGVDWIGGPAEGGSYYFGSVPSAPSCVAVDGLSGAKDCTVTGYASTVGAHTLTATAHDVADNTGTASRSYSVLAWSLEGFYRPVDMGGVWNTVKGGSTVPLKFEIFAGSTELTDVAAIERFTVKPVSCSAGVGSEDSIELNTTGGTVLRYDSTGGQFIQNWQTPKSPGSCYAVTMTTKDGSAISANFKLK